MVVHLWFLMVVLVWLPHLLILPLVLLTLVLLPFPHNVQCGIVHVWWICLHQQCNHIHHKWWFVGWLISDVKLGKRWWCRLMGLLHNLIRYILLVLWMHLGMALCALQWLQLLINNNEVFYKSVSYPRHTCRGCALSVICFMLWFHRETRANSPERKDSWPGPSPRALSPGTQRWELTV